MLEKKKKRKPKLDKKKFQFKISYLKRKAGKSTKNNGDDELLKQVIDYEEQITQLGNENRELEQLAYLLQDNETVTFQEEKYCDEVREVIMELLSMDVSMNQVNNVIKIVLSWPIRMFAGCHLWVLNQDSCLRLDCFQNPKLAWQWKSKIYHHAKKIV